MQKEEMPHTNAPKPQGRRVRCTAWADASSQWGKQADTEVTYRYMMFLNRTNILWHSKRQNTVGASTLGQEFIVLTSCIEAITQLRFKLKMSRIPFDDESVILNATMVESTLNKEYNPIAHHLC